MSNHAKRCFLLDKEKAFLQTVSALWAYGKGYSVWLLEGQLGSGKTTLIQALCALIGCPKGVVSPSFTLIHAYDTKEGSPIYHMDMYRLRSPHEADELGLDDYFNSGAYCFVEWADRIRHYFPIRYLYVQLSVLGAKQRQLDVHQVSEAR